MAKSTLYTCDGEGCSATRQQSNHWIIAVVKPTGISLHPWSEDILQTQPSALYLCGAGCATKTLSKQIHDWVEPPAPPSPKEQAVSADMFKRGDRVAA